MCQCLIQNKRIQSEYELVIQIQVLAAFALCNMHGVSVSLDFVKLMYIKVLLYICQYCFALYTMQVPSGQHMQGVRVSGALGNHFVHMLVYFV